MSVQLYSSIKTKPHFDADDKIALEAAYQAKDDVAMMLAFESWLAKWPTVAAAIPIAPFFINQSRWKAYQDCDRMYGWQYLANVTVGSISKFEIGTAVHNAMVYVHERNASPESIKEATEAAKDAYLKSMSGPTTADGVKETAEGARTIERLLPAYFSHWGRRNELWKPLGMEVWFCVEVGEGTNVFLVGRIDNLITWDGGLWLVDYKTMDKLDFRNFTKFEIDVQLTAYLYGATKQLSLESKARGGKTVFVRGAWIDGLVKTQIPQFHREPYTRSVQDLREFEEEFVEKVREIAQKHARVAAGENWKVVFPKNTNQCFRYGTCPWRDLCVQDTEYRRSIFKQRNADYVDIARMKADGSYPQYLAQVAEQEKLTAEAAANAPVVEDPGGYENAG